MSDSESLCREVYAAIERGARRVLASQSIVVKADESGKVAVSGELEDIVTKRKVVLAAASVTGVRELEDHTRLIPSESRADGEILDSLYQAMSSESVFRDYAIAGEDGGPNGARYSNPRDASGVVEILVKDAVATLVGNVESLTHRRLAEVLAWWTPGVVHVANQLHVAPPEDDSDGELTDALRIVLEKDPWLDASQISIHAQAGKIVLEGLLGTAEQRHMAECNAWYLNSVRSVENRIQVAGQSAAKS